MIVGLSGYARSGKDTVGGFLVESGFVRIAFADKLKKLVTTFWPGILDPHDGDWERAKADPAIRVLLQTVGQGARDVLSDNVWVDAALGGCLPEDVVVTDLRYPNEARRIKDLGGLIVRIERPGIGPANNHSSEIAMASWRFDLLIQNDGTLDDLKREALQIASFGAYR